MNSAFPDDEPLAVGETDRAAARRALARNWPSVEPRSPKYAGLLGALAELHRQGGRDKFELRYNLRPPRDRTEEWSRQFINGQITEAEFGALMKADAERPIDIEMLTTFCNAYQNSLSHYSGVLQRAVATPEWSINSAWQAAEKAIDGHVAALCEKLPLWRENLETIFEFLEERRVTSGAGLVKLGEFEGTSAHWLAELLFTRMREAWQSCKGISDRSRLHPRYLYADSAIELFQQWLPAFPRPQSISERLREEFILARAALKGIGAPAAIKLPTASAPSVDVHTVEQSLDNESRERVLVGEVTSLVAKAGHIFREISNSDQGIDGEIEFKDGSGQASGRRVYLQLKSGDSYLVKRAGDGEEIFRVKKLRHLQYWVAHAYPVLLVIRQSSGLIRWMDVSAYLKRNGQSSCQIVFRGEQVTIDSLRQLAEKSLNGAEIAGE